MANYKVSGTDELIEALSRIGQLPEDVLTEALDGMAAVAKEKIRDSGHSMGVFDPESNVHILDNIKTGKAKKTEDGGTEAISFSGNRTRGRTKTRNAEIAFINEYGKRGQRARPFIRQALEKNEEEITKPAEKVIGGWIEKEFKN